MTNSSIKNPTRTEFQYEGYEEWKGWSETFVYTKDHKEYFFGETKDIAIKGADILEIGFGSGDFLSWAQDAGAKSLHGTELNPVLIEDASKHDISILPQDFETIADEFAGSFDTVIGLDVFEHMSFSDIDEKLQALEIMLRPGGKIVMRFPNGQSPFGLSTQNADSTHLSALSRRLMGQLLQGKNLEILRYGPPYRIVGGGLKKGIGRRIRYICRDLLSFVLNFVYAQNIPWDPIVVLVLRKPDKPAD